MSLRVGEATHATAPEIAAWLAALAAMDPAAWSTGLSPAAARAAWAQTLASFRVEDFTAPVAGVPPAAVAIIASNNVFTAPLVWALHLRARGVRVRMKPARTQRAVAEAIAGVLGVELYAYEGGEEAAEAEMFAPSAPSGGPAVDGVIAFGGQAAMEGISARLAARCPRAVFLGFGPRFGVAVWSPLTCQRLLDGDLTPLEDLALYDSRGCMSPAAVFVPATALPPLDALSAALDTLEARWPRGALSAEEGARLRARTMLARVRGQAREGRGWAIHVLPPATFQPEALPRLLVLHPFSAPDEIAQALAPTPHLLATIALEPPLPAGLDALTPPHARRCLPGQMQSPGSAPVHEGVAVLERLWQR